MLVIPMESSKRKAARIRNDPEGISHPGRWKRPGGRKVPFRTSAMTSRSQAVKAGHLEQVGELLAGIEHPGLHRALGNPDDLAGFLHRFLMIIDEVDDLAVRGRH